MQQYSSYILMAAIFAAFYLLFIRPQQIQAKQQREMLSRLAPGMEIVTTGGIFANVVSVEDDRLRVALVDGAQLEILRSAVHGVITSAAHDADNAEEDADGVRDAEAEDGASDG